MMFVFDLARGGWRIFFWNLNSCGNALQRFGNIPTSNGSRRSSSGHQAENMDLEEDLLTIPINPNNFPAKLWHLVNNPLNRSIRWDLSGEGVIINQQLFEAEMLSPQKHTFENIFKTTNFTSFIRQLNLYGFRKMVGSDEMQSDGTSPTGGIQHHFHNQNFKQDHPELLVNLKRLTSSNKAKMEAGLEVNCRPPNRFRRLMTNGEVEDKGRVEKRGSAFIGPPHPYHLNRSQPMKEYDRTPVPPRRWMMGHGDGPSPTTLYTDKGIPISVIHRFPADTSCAVQSSPTPVHIQHGAQGLANPGQKFNSFIPHHTQYRPGFYSPAVCQCCPTGEMDSDMTASAHQTASYSHYSYYQPNCPVSFLYPGNQNQDWQISGCQAAKKNDVNLDRAFQIVDELQASPKIRMVRVGTPEKQVVPTPTSGPQPCTSIHSSPLPVSSQLDTSLNSSSIPVTPCGPIIIAVSRNIPQGIAVTESGPLGETVKVEQEKPLIPESETTHVVATHKEASEFSSSWMEDTEALDIEVTNTLHASVTQSSRSIRKQTKSPDLNMLVEEAES